MLDNPMPNNRASCKGGTESLLKHNTNLASRQACCMRATALPGHMQALADATESADWRTQMMTRIAHNLNMRMPTPLKGVQSLQSGTRSHTSHARSQHQTLSHPSDVHMLP